MINKYTNKQRGLLAVIMAMVMVFAGAAFIAAEVDAANVAEVDGKGFPSLTEAIASAEGKEIKILSDIEYEGELDGTTKEIILDGNGKKITFTGGANHVTGVVSMKNMTVLIDHPEMPGFMFGGAAGTPGVEVESVVFECPVFVYTGTVGFNKCIFNQDFQIQGSTPVMTLTECTIGTLVNNPSSPSTSFTVGTNIIVDEKTTINKLAVMDVLVIDNDVTLAVKEIAPFTWMDGDTLQTETPGKVVINEGGKLNYTTLDNKIVVIDNNSDDPFEVKTPADAIAAFEAGAQEVEITEGTITSMDPIPAGKSLVIGSKVIVNTDVTFELAGMTSQIVFKSDISNKTINLTYDEKTVIITNATGSFTFTGGSIVIIGGQEFGGKITANGADLKISGIISNDLEIDASVSTLTFIDSTTVNPGVELSIVGTYVDEVFTAKIDKNATFYLYGSLVMPADGKTLKMEVGEKATFKAFGGATIPEDVVVVAKGDKAVVDLADAMSTMTINDDVVSSNTYSQMQTVVIADTLTLKNTTVTTILGKFVVNEGVTLTIEEGAKLVINSTTADMIVDGTIIVEEGGDLVVTTAKSVSVAGEIDSEGSIFIDSTVTVKENGTITIASGDKSKIEVKKGLTIENGGELDVRAEMIINGITNKGTVSLNGAVLGGPSTITMAADGAIVDVKSYTCKAAYELKIDNYGATLGKDSDGKDVVVNSVNSDKMLNRVAFTGSDKIGLSGFKVVNSVTSKTENGKINYYNNFVLSGSIGIVDETGGTDPKTGIFYVRACGGVDVDENLTIGKGITFHVVVGEFNVAGEMTVVAESTKVEIESGEVNVSGMLQTTTQITTNINAAMYEADVNGTPNYYYTSFAKAIASGDDEIAILGKIAILENVTVPTGVKVKNNGIMEVGDSKNRDVTVTFADGSEIRNGTIDVYGTVVFDNKKNMKGTIVNSDVAVIGDVSAMYTNLYTALANAKAGDVVTLTRTNVAIDSDLTIPADVTLDVPSGKTLTVEDDVTVTVLGTLKSASAVLAETAFATEASETASAIIVDGTFMSMADIIFTYYNIPGAYYNIVDTTGNYNYVTPVEAAQAVAQTVTGGTIGIYGENDVSDVSFTGTSTQPITITVYADAEVEFDSIALGYASLVVADGACVTGVVKSDSAEVSLTHVDNITITASVKDDATVTTVSGTPGKGDVDVDAKVTVSTGTVIIDYDLILDALKSFTISNGAVVKVEKSGVLSATSLTVDGELIAINGGKVSVTTLTINGTLTVAEADTTAGITAGSASVTTMYVGVTAKALTSVIGAGAIVNGDVKFTDEGIMYVLEGSSIPEDLVKDIDSIAYYVEDKVWITAYDFGATSAQVNKIPMEDVYLKEWVTDKGEPAMNEDWSVTFDGEKKVYADIEYNVYDVTVTAVAGIDAVYMDGILMTGTMTTVNGNTFTATVSAGVHKITYTLANGYSGEATMIVNGEKVTGTEFTAGGTFKQDSTEYSIILQGIVKAPAEAGSVVEEEGMDLTDILLIVLVVLIVIMAIIVALRMMRS